MIVIFRYRPERGVHASREVSWFTSSAMPKRPGSVARLPNGLNRPPSWTMRHRSPPFA